MTPRPMPPDELLSAGHDGELSSAERAEADRLLAETPALQETLDDFRELTAILQSLPRPAAPAALQSNVLRQVEASRPAATPARRRRPWLWGLSLAATAALLLIAVGNRRPRGPQFDRVAVGEREVTMIPSPAVPAIVAGEDKALSESVADGYVDLPADRTRPASVAVPAMTAERVAPRAAAVETAAGSPPLPAAPGGAARGVTLGVAGGGAQRLVFDPTNPPTPSEILAYVDRVGDETVIVEFDVVDVDRTADDVLVLLQRRGVTVVGEQTADSSSGRKTQPATQPTSEPEPLVAVYVEAPESQLAEVLDDVMSQVSISDGSALNEQAAGPLLTDRLQVLKQQYRADRTVARRAAAAPPSASAAAPSAAPAAEPQAAASAPLQALPPATGLGESAEAPAQAMRLAMPAGTYQQLETRSGAAQLRQESATPPRGGTQSFFAKRLPEQRPGDEKLTSLRRMLFVLHREMR